MVRIFWRIFIRWVINGILFTLGAFRRGKIVVFSDYPLTFFHIFYSISTAAAVSSPFFGRFIMLVFSFLVFSSFFPTGTGKPSYFATEYSQTSAWSLIEGQSISEFIFSQRISTFMDCCTVWLITCIYYLSMAISRSRTVKSALRKATGILLPSLICLELVLYFMENSRKS